MTAKSGTGCLPAGAKVELLNDGTSISIDTIPVLWVSNIDENRKLTSIVDPARGGEEPAPGATNVVTDIETFIPIPLLSSEKTEVIPLFRVLGTEPSRLITIEFEGGFKLETSDFHPIKTGDNTLTRAMYLREGNTVTTTVGVAEVAGFEYSDSINAKVYNLGLCSRDVFEVFRGLFIALNENALSTEENPIQYTIANDTVKKAIASIQEQSKTNYLGLNPREHIIFTDNVATGSYTLQNLLVGYTEPLRFVDISKFD